MPAVAAAAGSRPPIGRVKAFVLGARPRTLPAAVVPVAVGVAVARALGNVAWDRAVLALVVSLAMQVGTNYANDYSDGVRGTDAERVGPLRLVGSGLVAPSAVRSAAIATFAIGALAGLVLAALTTPWLIAVGAASIAAGWLYTGGPKPYGYLGLGELFVFVFFGLVAVVGTAYVTAGRLAGIEFLAAVPVGLLAVALLVVNNLRDIPGDTAAGKRTLAVMLGAGRTRVLYAGCVLVAIASAASVAAFRPTATISLAAAVFAVAPLRVVLSGTEGRGLVRALVLTGTLQLALGALLCVGIAT